MSATALALPECTYEDLPTARTALDAWAHTLVDTVYTLTEDYAPQDLVSLREAGFADDRLIRAIVIHDLAALRQAAEDLGHPLEVQSAYRSYDYQVRTFAYWVAQSGMDAALASSARPGHSEHQLGTALDFRSRGGPAPWDMSDWAETPAGAWLTQNSWRYGFILSYPRGMRDVTCYIYEPWHYRYVGRERAALIHESGLTLREFLWLEHRAAETE